MSGELVVDAVGHGYGHGARRHHALDQVSFSVGRGELVTIVGPSGCGKSTLLRAVAGLLRPATGQVLLDGEPVRAVPDGLAVVFQDYSRSLFPWLTVAENVALPLRRRRIPAARRRAAALEALEAVGLTGAARRHPWELSGGMQQRAALARALACRPELLLMDEPFGSVDAQTRDDLEDLLLAVRARHGMTVLLVTHDIDESVYLGDRVLVLAGPPGRLAADLAVPLPPERDQVTSRALPAFVGLRARVAALVRGRESGPAG